MTFKFQNQPLTRQPACEPERAEHDFRGRVVEAHQLGAGRQFLNPLGDFNFQFRLRRPMRAELRLRRDGIGKPSRSVPEKQRTLPCGEINVFIPVHIKKPRARAVVKGKRHGLLHFADAAVDATGDAALGALVKRAGFGKFVSHDWNADLSRGFANVE